MMMIDNDENDDKNGNNRCTVFGF